jgi:glycosyltransferase involved in cell wall biosynthesis
LKVLHVSPSFFPAGHYGGPTYSTHSLCNSVAQLPDVELKVLTTDSDGPRRMSVQAISQHPPVGYEVEYCRRWFQPDIAPEMFLRLYSQIRWANVVHLTSVYSASTIPTMLLCRLLHKPLVWSTRGALQRWGQDRRTRIKAAWEVICNALCEPHRVLLHTTSRQEAVDSAARIPRARVAEIPNGIDLPNLNGDRHARNPAELSILYLGRLHPIKGIENLLAAMAKLKQPARLAICGTGEVAYQDRLRSMVQDLGLNNSVKFQGRVDGVVKDGCFNEADVCVVPSYQENFCLVVAESLAHRVPVIASTGTPWQRVEEIGCGLWIENQPDELAAAIDRAATMPLAEMGQRGRAWMQREYSWATIAQQMYRQYEALIETNAAPRHQRAA